MRSLPEVASITEIAKKHHLTVLFGPEITAAIAIQVKLIRSSIERGKIKFEKVWKIPLLLTDLLEKSVPLELVVSGSRVDTTLFEDELNKRYPYKLPDQTPRWVLRSHQDAEKDSPYAAFNWSAYETEYFDSFSTSLLEAALESPTLRTPSIRDMRKTADQPKAIIARTADLVLQGMSELERVMHTGQAEFYLPQRRSELAALNQLVPRSFTTRPDQVRENEIIFALRFLAHLFAAGLTTSPDSDERIMQIVDGFKGATPSEVEQISNLAIRILSKAQSHSLAYTYLEETGIQEKLQTLIADNERNVSLDSSLHLLKVWLNRKPLPSFPVGQGTGLTAADLRLKEIFHEARTFEAFDQIAGSPAQAPRLLMSRADTPGERAKYGNGVYFTPTGLRGHRFDQGVHLTGYIIPMLLNPEAREGTDFETGKDDLGQTFILLKNAAAVQITPEFTPFQESSKYLMDIRLQEGTTYRNRGLFLKIKQRYAAYWRGQDPQRLLDSLESTDPLNNPAKWIYFPDVFTEKFVTEKMRKEAARELDESKHAGERDTDACHHAANIAASLIKYAKTGAEFLEILGSKHGKACEPFFSFLWIENASRFVRSQTQASQVLQARKMAGSYDASLAILRAATQTSLTSYSSTLLQILDPIFTVPHDHSYRQELREIWQTYFPRIYLRPRTISGGLWPITTGSVESHTEQQALKRVLEPDSLPLAEKIELFLSSKPEQPYLRDPKALENSPPENPDSYCIDPPTEEWASREGIVARYAATLKGEAQLPLLEGLFRFLESTKPREWKSNLVYKIRRDLLQSRFATTYFLNRFLPQVDLKNDAVLKVITDPKLKPDDAPEWTREAQTYLRKATQLRDAAKPEGGECNALL